ncbi:pilin [Luteimonas sp. BDR2-5]|nr:pilin [Luteimonas sp. BDR2-5]
MTAALADISGGRSMYESKLMAEDITSFDPEDIGLSSETPRCGEINLISGFTGHIECVVRGHPMINGAWIRITRDEAEGWSCSTEASIPARVKPRHCS